MTSTGLMNPIPSSAPFHASAKQVDVLAPGDRLTIARDNLSGAVRCATTLAAALCGSVPVTDSAAKPLPPTASFADHVETVAADVEQAANDIRDQISRIEKRFGFFS